MKKQMIPWTMALISVLAARTEFNYVGVQAFRQCVDVNDIRFETQGTLASWYYTDGMYYGHFGLGAAEAELVSANPGTDALTSNMKFTWNFDLTRMMQLFYVSTGVNYYNVSGDVGVMVDQTEYLYRNSYKIYEFPVGTGLHVNTPNLFLLVGIRQNYYFGRLHYRNYLVTDADPLQINDVKTSFTERGGKMYEAALTLFPSASFYVNIHYAFDTKTDDEYSSVTLGFRF